MINNFSKSKRFTNTKNVNRLFKKSSSVGKNSLFDPVMELALKEYEKEKVQPKKNISKKKKVRRQITYDPDMEIALQEYIIDEKINKAQYSSIFNGIVNGEFLNQQQADRLWSIFNGQDKYNIEVTNIFGAVQVFTLRGKAKDYFKHLVMGVVTVNVEQYGSDVMTDYNYEQLTSINLTKVNPGDFIVTNKDGNFFPYINTTTLDLKKYQIFNQYEAKDKDIVNNREQCLIHTLLTCGVDESLVNNVKLAYSEDGKISNIRKKDMVKIASIIQADIKLFHLDKNGEKQSKIYKCKNSKNEMINICIYNEHFFIKEKTKYSMYSIKNYNLVKDEKDFHDILKKSRKTFYRSKTSKIDSLKLVERLFKDGYFVKGDLSMFHEVKQSENIYLDNIENEQRPCEYEDSEDEDEEEDDKIKPKIFYADFESYVHTQPHSIQLLGVVSEDSDDVTTLNVNDYNKNTKISSEQLLIYKFLNILTNYGKSDAICFFHNLKYDYHLLEQYVNIEDRCIKDNQFYSIKIKFKNKKIELRDSFKLIPFALSKFQEVFDLEEKYGKKEAISYKYYTKDNNNKRIKTKKYAKLLSIDDKKIFKKQVKKCKSYNKKLKTFNPLVYYIDYLRLDCLVLKKGLEKFNGILKDITDNKISAYDYLTISSVTDNFMKKEGVFRDVYEVSGNLREYISKSAYGGRVSVNKKYVKKIVTGKIADYDGVSLYPSAINRL